MEQDSNDKIKITIELPETELKEIHEILSADIRITKLINPLAEGKIPQRIILEKDILNLIHILLKAEIGRHLQK